MRTRFAPSPTGYMHIGNLRTALYEYLIAKSQDGKFILRIEDTDQDRYVEGAMDVVFNTLKLTGIEYDEGPYVGGDYGPYIQSERKEIYKKYAKLLVEKKEAYYCFCSKERLESVRLANEHLGAAFNYDRHCLNLRQEEIDTKLANRESYVIRQKMPREGKTTFTDLVYGHITVDNSTLDDQVLLKSDGLPTYNFANVVDDHLMEITHVVRGNEYLSSTPKYNKLYDAFGWQIPTYVHLPPVMKDSKTKLSKRHGDASFQDLIDKGYLPEAILNYIALLGWSPRDNKEIFSLKELEENFYIEGLSKSPAIFDIEKLTWMNGEYIKAMDFDSFFNLTKDDVIESTSSLLKDRQVEMIARAIQSRISVLTEIKDLVAFYSQLPDYDTGLFVHKKMKTDEEISLKYLKIIRDELNTIEDFTSANIFDLVKDITQKYECRNSQILWPMRTALSGLESSPGGASELAEILGREETIRRIDYAIGKLGG